jgi:hypothetical protein
LENNAQLKVLVEGWTSQHKIEDIVTLLLENRVCQPKCSISLVKLTSRFADSSLSDQGVG